MARKSAKSKGYRKVATKKPYLSKRDIIILCVLLAAVAVGAILLFTYDDGALKYKDGKIVDPGDNWVIVNGSASGGRRYFKLAEAGDIEGFIRSSEPMISDANLSVIRYTPESEDSPVSSISVTGSPSDAVRVAEYYRSVVSGVEPSELQTGDADGVPFHYFTYQTAYHVDEVSAEEVSEEAPAEEAAEEVPAEEAEAEAPADDAEEAPADDEAAADEPAPNRFEQAIHAYIDAPYKSAIGVIISVKADSEADFLDDAQLVEYAQKAIGAISLEEGKR